MDPLSASCCSLNYDRRSSQIIAQLQTEEKYLQILGSIVSVSKYEKKDIRNLKPQFIAAVLVTSYHVAIGISLAFSAIFLPQFEENREFDMSQTQTSWTVSIIALTTPVGCLIVGVLMDHFGRLRTLLLAAVPGISGWVIIALSTNGEMVILGRALVGFATALGSNPAVVYLTEIARKDMRGSLISFAPGLASLGMVLTFIMGWFMNWRYVAWCTNLFIVIPSVCIFLLPESPAWLVSKDRIAEAKRSLEWINKYQPMPENRNISLAELQLALLQKERELKLIAASRRADNEIVATVRRFTEPTAYKPMLILVGLFFFQQFSGIFVFLFNSITFFQDVGSKVDPYLTSIFIGVLRFAMSMVNTYVQKTFKRRPLMLVSCVTMSACLFSSGLFSHWIQNGTVTVTWMPVIFLLVFVVSSMIGLIPIPFTMTAELFPLEIRGVANSISICNCNMLMFASLQLYPIFLDLFGDIVRVQYYFAVICLVGALYTYVFMPETQEKKLSEIEEYFRNNVVFLGSEKEQNDKEASKFPVRANIVKGQPEHEEHLLEEVLTEAA